MKMKTITLALNVTKISERSVKKILVAISIWKDTLRMLFSGVCSFKWSWIIHLNPVLFSSFPDSVNWLILWWKDLLNWNWNHVSNIMTSKIEVPANCMVSIKSSQTFLIWILYGYTAEFTLEQFSSHYTYSPTPSMMSHSSLF